MLSKKRLLSTLVLAGAVALAGCAQNSVRSEAGMKKRSGNVAAHPSELKFEDRELQFPSPDQYRVELIEGNVAYVVPDATFPLVKIQVLSPAGTYMLDDDQAALAGLTATMLRDGGTEEMTPDELDERLDFLATIVGFNIGATSSSASLNTLSENLDESLDLMFDMLTEPGLNTERLEINKSRVLEEMRKRNDDTRRIEPRYWNQLQYGDDFFINDMATQSDLERVDAAAMDHLVDQVFASGPLIFAVSGAVDPKIIAAKLNQQLERLPDASALPEIPSEVSGAAPGVYGVNKDDVSQTRVRIGHLGPMRDHPDRYAIAVMNDILGGGGFTSRIATRVRSDEGLAYSAGSRFALGRHYPGEFRAGFQSKNLSVPEAVQIVLEEIDNIRTNPVSEKELATAKESQVAFLADLYSSADAMARRFASDDLNDEAPDYWKSYEGNIRAVTQEDVLRVAQTHLRPEDLHILVVGKLDDAQQGEAGKPNLEAVTGQSLQELNLVDPLTLEPLQ